MGDGLQFLDIIFFAMVAGFILLRLRSVLGRRTGNERQRRDPYRVQERDDEKVVTLPDRRSEAQPSRSEEEERQLWGKGTSNEAGLTQIRIADPTFDPGTFLEGARAAYEMIVTAFAQGDRESLRSLLSDDVYADFEAAIAEREAQNQTMETSITAIHTADIVEARMDGRSAEVTVKFVSDTVSALKDAAGEPIGGPAQEREVTDIWTFARDTGTPDPNWLLIETRSEN